MDKKNKLFVAPLDEEGNAGEFQEMPVEDAPELLIEEQEEEPNRYDENGVQRQLKYWHPHYTQKRREQRQKRMRRVKLRKLQAMAAKGNKGAETLLRSMYSVRYGTTTEVAGRKYEVTKWGQFIRIPEGQDEG